MTAQPMRSTHLGQGLSVEVDRASFHRRWKRKWLSFKSLVVSLTLFGRQREDREMETGSHYMSAAAEARSLTLSPSVPKDARKLTT